jgi:hypothetical protein
MNPKIMLRPPKIWIDNREELAHRVVSGARSPKPTVVSVVRLK